MEKKQKIGAGIGLEIVGLAMSNPAWNIPQFFYYAALITGALLILWGAFDWIRNLSFNPLKIPLHEAVKKAINARISLGLPFDINTKHAMECIALDLTAYSDLYGVRSGATILEKIDFQPDLHNIEQDCKAITIDHKIAFDGLKIRRSALCKYKRNLKKQH